MDDLDELDFVAVELQTAGADPASVCALGVALVRGGEVATSERWLVRPPTGPDSFSRMHARLHGVDADAVADAPEWAEVAAQLDLLGEHLPLVACGADRQRAVYEAASRAAGLAPQPHTWRDALDLVRRLRPDVTPVRLAPAADALGVAGDGADGEAEAIAVRTAELVLALARGSEQGGRGGVADLWSDEPTATTPVALPDEPIVPASLRRHHVVEPVIEPVAERPAAFAAPAAAAHPATVGDGVGWKVAGVAMVALALASALFFVASVAVIMEYLGDGRGSDATVGMGMAALAAFLAWWFGKTGVGWIRR